MKVTTLVTASFMTARPAQHSSGSEISARASLDNSRARQQRMQAAPQFGGAVYGYQCKQDWRDANRVGRCKNPMHL